MRHRKKGKKLGRTASHRKALLSNLASELFEHKRIVTTLAKAKALRPFAERLITKAKKGYIRERDGLLPEGHKVDLTARRYVARFIRRKAVVQELFESIAPVVVERPGGYTRIVKLSRRRGDGARMAVIELVDWSAPQDGQVYLRRKQVTEEEFEVVSAGTEEGAESESIAAAETETPVETEAQQVSTETAAAVAAEETAEEMVPQDAETEQKAAEDSEDVEKPEDSSSDQGKTA